MRGCGRVDVSPARHVESPIPGLISVSPARSKGEDRPVEVDLPSRVSTPEFKASAEEKRARRAVRQEKGHLLEERLSWWLRG